MFITNVCKCLNDAKIPYAVVGGYAVAIHGAIRGTIDVDIVIEWTLENLVNVETALKKMGLVSQLPITADNIFHFRKEYIKNRNLIAWNFYNKQNPHQQVDLIINYDLKNHRVKTIKSSSGIIKVLSKGDLIAMKTKSGRPQDIEDAKALEAL